ncbi:MAG: helical backbone metal receptor [Thermoanaerobaculia bacterium]
MTERGPLGRPLVVALALALATAALARGAERLALLAPAAAETVGALGAAARVVAVGDFVTFPPALAAKPKVGAYDQPSLERLLELRVDLLITVAGVAGRGERDRLRDSGIAVLEIDTESYDGALAAIGEVGEAVGEGAAARRLVARVEARVAAVAARTRDLPPRRVLIVVGQDPLFVVGPGSALDRLLAAAGGTNVAADVGRPFAQVSLEAMLERRPEVVIDLADNRPGAARGAVLGAWERWPFLPAVAEHRVYHVDPAGLAIPGPRLGEMAETLARLVHPELFGEPTRADFLGPQSR